MTAKAPEPSITTPKNPDLSKPTAKTEPNSKPSSRKRPLLKHRHSPKSTAKLTPGARNLILLGLGATIIAIITTSIGLAIYHLSGDIYLDRSRPGYMPDEAEVVEEEEAKPEAYNFEKSGPIDRATLEEYLKHLTEELNAVDSYKDPFNASSLSDDHLGIPAE